MSWETIIGLEIHAQLATHTKAFCRCPNLFGAPPNTLTCPVCLGMPGALPVLSQSVVEKATILALALGAKINSLSKFDRKNYFYPDLPKGYQISQFHRPFSTGGELEIDVRGSKKNVHITRAHIEEDAGKSAHLGDGSTVVDMNRSGVPLVEIVSEPDMRSPEEAAAYVTAMRELLRFAGVCDGNMEQGSLRCDANVSVRRFGDSGLNERSEIKNLNSIRNVERALKTEVLNQIRTYESGGAVQRSTLLWDDQTDQIRVMRRKEGSDDYRYFPEPDLVELHLSEAEIELARKRVPKLPREIRSMYAAQYGWNAEQIQYVMLQQGGVQYVEDAILAGAVARTLGNILATQVSGIISDAGLTLEIFRESVTPERLAKLTQVVSDGVISPSSAKGIIQRMMSDSRDPREIIKTEGLAQVSDDEALLPIVQKVIADFPDEADRYRAGKKNLMGHFVAQAKKASGGTADPKALSRLLQKQLDEGETS